MHSAVLGKMDFLVLAQDRPEGLLPQLDMSHVMERKPGADLSKVLDSNWCKS